MVDAAHEVYGQDIEIWAREVGCLVNNACALESVNRLDKIVPMLDRWAFFISDGNSEGWDYTSLYREGELTGLGKAYRDWVEPETFQGFLPMIKDS